ncbi:MAG: 5'/3'-nucleotidase SurE [Sphingobacteriales bacterium JAD_PAG50586_3]|nr:MAG: 5'/3'-nucleotidase SurE [Sphingobacteriales bacterium JAD_PAG50586_3]
MSTTKPLILITNDDGITAPGIRALVTAMKAIGDVVVVAPDKPQSGMGHAITINSTLRLYEVKQDGLTEHACSGTPVDCVKIAIDKILPRKPDLLVSGINHGANSSINVIYSGTMSAAVEGAIEGIPSIGFSLCNYSIEADFTAAAHFAGIIAKNVLDHGMPDGVCLNVNIPDVPLDIIKGVKVCRQAKSMWHEEFDERKDPYGRKYYWLTGKFVNLDSGDDTDQWALENNYVSVVPTQFDLTAHTAIKDMKKWEM